MINFIRHALVVFLALISTSCAATRGASDHLIAKEITLVDEHGKPWLHIGQDPSSYLRGISILSEGGEEVISIGLEHIMEADKDSEAIARAGDWLPSIRLESAEGDGIVDLMAHRSGAVLSLISCDRTGVDVGVKNDEINLAVHHQDDAGEEATTLNLVLDAVKLLLTVKGKDGGEKVIDLHTLLP